MMYKVLIAPIEPSIDDRPNYSGILADYDIEAGSETEAGDLGVYSVSVRKIPIVPATAMITS